MNLRSLATLTTLLPYALGYSHLANFPRYSSLAGLSQEDMRAVLQSFGSTPGAQPLPPPINDTSAKLVNDLTHPYEPVRPGDIRGPCPGLNTLASHGVGDRQVFVRDEHDAFTKYLNHTGVATPAEIITAVQEGFNMEWQLAAFVTYAAFIVDGNHLTNLMTIGANITTDCQHTPGLSVHGTVEGDASTTRGDYYFGDNHSFNKTQFDQLVAAADSVGGGMITIESASLQKAQRIHDSITRNPTFMFETPRFSGAYAETTFPMVFFVSNQTANTTVNATLDDARSFFEFHRYPEGFYRRQAPYGLAQLEVMFNKVFDLIRVPPGHNEGVGNYVVNTADDASPCYAYQRQVNLTARLYPDPIPEVKTAIKANLVTFYQTLADPSCKQLFPYGQ